MNTTAFLRRMTTCRDEAIRQNIPVAPDDNLTPRGAGVYWQRLIDEFRAKDPMPTFPLNAEDFSDLPYGIAVHVGHCCKRHGCKYGHDESCAVALGEFKQAHPCEFCGEDDEEKQRLLALMDKHYPVKQPAVPRKPNRWGDDPEVDARNAERSTIEDFIDLMFEEA